ncbi:transposase [Streptomyces sp. NBC_00354]
MQQFMTSSTWPVGQVRAELAWRAVRVVRPQVWAVDDTGFASSTWWASRPTTACVPPRHQSSVVPPVRPPRADVGRCRCRPAAR